MPYVSDIEDFTVDQLRAEIHRRETAAREHRCWYCGKNIAAHTCKHADANAVAPGWEVKPPRFVRTESCMGDKTEYWQTDAKHTVLGTYVIGNADTAKESTKKCLDNIKAEF